MTQEHPITPPPELVEKWLESTRSDDCIGTYPTDFEQRICTAAARWGADEACLQWFSAFYCMETWMQRDLEKFRDARRTKTSLKEDALAELELLRGDANAHGLGFDAPAIRRALESLPD